MPAAENDLGIASGPSIDAATPYRGGLRRSISSEAPLGNSEPEDAAPEQMRSPSRRDGFAEMTRRDVIDAARKLFADNGYAQTTVESIARAARVSPATVYAQCGGKEGLLGTLMDMWTTRTMIQGIIDECAAADSGRAKLEVLARGYVTVYQVSGDIISIVTRAAASSPSAERFLATADERHEAALREVVEQIRDVGDLAVGLSVGDAARMIFFHFRYDQLALAAERFGWGIERTTNWLTERVSSAILEG
jgi:AcrR family transcriptional regulator